MNKWKYDLKDHYMERESIDFSKNEKEEIINKITSENKLNKNEVIDYYEKSIDKWKEEKNKRKFTYKEQYQEGEKVLVKVWDVRNYGVLVYTMDNHFTRGLIHISEIRNGFVEDPAYYFEVDQEIKAEIVEWNPYKGQLSLSTKFHNFKQEDNDSSLNRNMIEKLKNVKRNLDKKDDLDYKVNGEIENIIKYLNRKIGVVSPKAKKELEKTIEKYGMFNFTLALTETINEFNPDFGILLLEEVKNNLKTSNIVEYIASDHSIDSYRKRVLSNEDLLTDQEIRQKIVDICYQGELIIEYEDLRYIKYNDLFIPCAKDNDSFVEVWVAKTVMNWEMVMKNLQKKADGYFSA